jgi:hypothetical protein
LIRSFVGWRPVLATQGIQLPAYLDASDTALGVVPHGLLHEIVDRRQRVSVVAIAEKTERLVGASLRRLQLPQRGARPEDASTVLGYALGAVNGADWLVRVGRGGAARSFYQSVLELHPDELEDAVRLDARRELGGAPPELELEARARAALARLDLAQGVAPLDKGAQ